MIDIKFGTPVPVVFYDNILADIRDQGTVLCSRFTHACYL